MTQEEIIEMAKQAGFTSLGREAWDGFDANFETFAKLVATKEREACAMLCESEWDGDADTYESTQAYNECAAAIRSRGEA